MGPGYPKLKNLEKIVPDSLGLTNPDFDVMQFIPGLPTQATAYVLALRMLKKYQADFVTTVVGLLLKHNNLQQRKNIYSMYFLTVSLMFMLKINTRWLL